MPVADLPENYCILPFIHTAIEADGSVKGCCLMPAFTDDNGNVLNLNEVSIQEALESKSYLQLLDSFRKNEKHKLCSQCWRDEADGTFSNRKKFNAHYRTLIQEKIEAELLYERRLHYLEVKAGAICNLKCRICGPHNSSRIAQEEAEYFNDPSRLVSVEKSQWVKNKSIWHELSNLDLREVHIMGGEPFLEKNHIMMLDKWIEDGRAGQIHLMYNSNGTIVPTEMLGRFNSFKSVLINLSIDDIGERFEYQRFPARWNMVLRNMEYYASIPSTNIKVNVDVCWSLMNIFYIEDIIDFFENHILGMPNFHRNSIVSGRHFYTGESFSPKGLSLVHKGKFLSKLEGAQNRLPQYQELIECLKGYVSANEPKTQNLFEKIKLLDRIRGQQFTKTFPEISFIFE
jgi:pyruvate-formate lyase-activating enzyme